MKQPRKMKTSRRLRMAARLLQRSGWIKHLLHNHNGYCMLGALARVDGLLEYNTGSGYFSVVTAQVEVPKVLAEAIGVAPASGNARRMAVARYNDTYGRGKCEVINTLCTAATAAEQKGD